MAQFNFNFDTDLIKQLERLENYDEIAENILKETIPILEKSVQNGVARHNRTGQLFKSIKAGKPIKNVYGWYASVFPRGKDDRGVRNAEKLIYMEYGTSKQQATPVLTKAIKDAESEVLDKMQEVFNKVVSE